MIGIVVEHEGQRVRIGARKGVVLACGGFEWNPALVRAHLGYDVYPLSPGGNTGDGLMMAVDAKAQLGNMDSYWGTPVMFDPEITRDGELVPQFEWGRGAPASIVVNQKGRRFANEALPYNDFPKAFGVYDTEAVEFPNAGARLPDLRPVGARLAADPVDAPRASPTPTGSSRPTPSASWPRRSGSTARRWRRPSSTTTPTPPTASTPTSSATATGSWRRARCSRSWRRRSTPSRSTRACSAPTAGPASTATARSSGFGGGLVGGLYAAGNTAANVFGWAYPSGGGTLGNGLVFGFLAGRHAAAQPARAI